MRKLSPLAKSVIFARGNNCYKKDGGGNLKTSAVFLCKNKYARYLLTNSPIYSIIKLYKNTGTVCTLNLRGGLLTEHPARRKEH